MVVLKINYILLIFLICLFVEPNAAWLESNKLKQLCKTDPALCPNQCGRSYKGKSRKSHLKRHLIHECGVPKKFRCDLCSRRFAYNVSLEKHLQSCTKNGYVFMDQHFLNSTTWQEIITMSTKEEILIVIFCINVMKFHEQSSNFRY